MPGAGIAGLGAIKQPSAAGGVTSAMGANYGGVQMGVGSSGLANVHSTASLKNRTNTFSNNAYSAGEGRGMGPG